MTNLPSLKRVSRKTSKEILEVETKLRIARTMVDKELSIKKVMNQHKISRSACYKYKNLAVKGLKLHKKWCRPRSLDEVSVTKVENLLGNNRDMPYRELIILIKSECVESKRRSGRYSEDKIIKGCSRRTIEKYSVLFRRQLNIV
jgi:hypothetical protein